MSIETCFPESAANHGRVSRQRWRLTLLLGLVASLGGAATYLSPTPAQLRVSMPYGLLFLAVGALQVGATVASALRPRPRWLAVAATAAGVVVMVWLLGRLGVLPPPDPWASVGTVVGFAGPLCAVLELLAMGFLLVVAFRRRPSGRSLLRRLLTGFAFVPVVALVLLVVVIGVIAGTDGFVGAGFPGAEMRPVARSAGLSFTVEYCRPGGVPLAMDIYPPAGNPGRAPVVLYVHGGGMILGDRKLTGAGAALANHEGALFAAVQRGLAAHGVMVASIDYRLLPAAHWPEPLQDAKCAVRFLRAHAASLRIDPDRIAAWGSSAGGQLAALLALTRTGNGFDVGQYPTESSRVQAVVDMFGPSDFNDMRGSAPFYRALVWLGLGASAETRAAASPISYVRTGAPPFLILQGTDDNGVLPHVTARFAKSLREKGVRTTYVPVEGAGHGLSVPTERPGPHELAATVVTFLTDTLE